MTRAPTGRAEIPRPSTVTAESARRHACDRDVVVVGGGPAGCSAAVFLGRAGLDVVVFDRGRSSIRRCAHLENYLGFPGGIDVETFYELMHEHAERAGSEVVADLVESVERAADGAGFVVEPQEGDPVTARRVVAATRYDGEYMRGLDDDSAMFATVERDGEAHEYFDREYAAFDGTTPVEGLYVASPSAEDDQAITAAGRGGRVARRVVADARLDDGWWPDVAEGVDWMRRAAELDDEWTDRERWIAWFDDTFGTDAPVEPGSDDFVRVREACVDDRLSAYLTDEEIAERAARGRERLASKLTAEAFVAAFDEEALLAASDAETVAGALDEETVEDALDEETVEDALDEEALLGTLDEEAVVGTLDEEAVVAAFGEEPLLATMDDGAILEYADRRAATEGR